MPPAGHRPPLHPGPSPRRDGRRREIAAADAHPPVGAEPGVGRDPAPLVDEHAAGILSRLDRNLLQPVPGPEPDLSRVGVDIGEPLRLRWIVPRVVADERPGRPSGIGVVEPHHRRHVVGGQGRGTATHEAGSGYRRGHPRVARRPCTPDRSFRSRTSDRSPGYRTGSRARHRPLASAATAVSITRRE